MHLQETTQKRNVISPFLRRNLPSTESTLYRSAISAKCFVRLVHSCIDKYCEVLVEGFITYAPSSTERFAALGAGDARPELAGDGDRTFPVKSKLMSTRASECRTIGRFPEHVGGRVQAITMKVETLHMPERIVPHSALQHVHVGRGRVSRQAYQSRRIRVVDIAKVQP